MKRLILVILIIGIGGFWFYQKDDSNEETIYIPDAIQYQDFLNEEESTEEVEEAQDEVSDVEIVTSTDIGEVTIKLVKAEEEQKILGEKIANNSINLAVPFTSQAPTGNWDQPWQDACEEASILMVDYYYQNKSMPYKKGMDKILFDMVAWQEENWQGHFNLTIEELQKYTEANYNYDLEIVDDLTVEKIKEYLDRGLPVIVPANGKILDNPYFSNGGPEYHMLVIKGYLDEENKFITNDPGTKRGKDFLYDYDNMMESIADWDKKRSSATGSKRALILYKN